MSKSQGGDLFIVDNSDADWKVQHYLHEWCQIARSMDVATGYFEIGALLALDQQWQKLENIRILMGDEVSKRTIQAFNKALEDISKKLDDSIESEKTENDFLDGVHAIVEALKNKQIICKVYKKKKFHAKAYITHGKLEVVGSAALVGSSNFTSPGLIQNVELNIQIRREVGLLQEWFEEHWKEAEDVTPEILVTVERHTRQYSPFEVYAKALQEFHSGHELTADEWEMHESQMYYVLSSYQREAYHGLMKISDQYRGAFLCDGVGLGKTFMGLMLIERLLKHDRKRVVLLVPKATRKPVWESELRKRLPDVLHNRFINLAIYNHTDLLRGDSETTNFPEEFEQIRKEADVFIIDEAHHFRNRASNRYRKLFDIIGADKQVFLLTATPINNSLLDLKHQVELFTGQDDQHFQSTPLNINNVTGHFRVMEDTLAREIGADDREAVITDDHNAYDVLVKDDLFQGIVVQRSRAYVKKSVALEPGEEVHFPVSEDPQVASYSLKEVYGDLLDLIEETFDRHSPLLKLAVYSPYDDPYFKGDIDEIEGLKRGRFGQIASLIRILLLKRFESSVQAFKQTCEDMLRKLLAFIEIHQPEVAKHWISKNEELIHSIKESRKEFLEEDIDDDLIPDELRNKWEPLSDAEFDIDKIVEATLSDLDQLSTFINHLHKLDPSHDDKIQTLIKLLKNDKDLKKHKVIIFTEFLATARYIERQLGKAKIGPLDEVDSGYKGDRGELITRFSPYYNDSSSGQLQDEGKEEIRVLVSTDVLAEGLNLQDATLLINYDLHWNPVRLMQRIGRVDRRLTPEIEEQIITAHPDTKKVRGKVRYWNFLPPEELNNVLTLYERVTHKTLRISKTFGIEGKKLLTPEDDYDALKDFNKSYEGTPSQVEEMYLAYKQMLVDNPGLEERLRKMPLKIFSGKDHPIENARAVFFCYRLPAQHAQSKEWSVDDGNTGWYLYDLSSGDIIEDPYAIDDVILSNPDTQRNVQEKPETLKEARKALDKHLHKTYMRKAQVPAADGDGNPINPKLMAWMEVS
jgi:superfamily II DNA or RNA helicase/HKD family nuclease